MERPELTPMWLGWRAGLEHVDPCLCPYAAMTRERREWERWHGYAVDLRSEYEVDRILALSDDEIVAEVGGPGEAARIAAKIKRQIDAALQKCGYK